MKGEHVNLCLFVFFKLVFLTIDQSINMKSCPNGLLIFISIVLMLSCAEMQKSSSQDELYTDGKFLPSDMQYYKRAFPKGTVDYEAIQKSNRYRKENLKSSVSREEPWQFVGPRNIDGRITDIELRKDGFNDIFVGTASGGLFRYIETEDTWMPLFDEVENLAIGDFDLFDGNNDVIYVGTGEANAGGGSLAYDGNGVYKSEDAGSSWSHMGLSEVGGIGKLLIHPEDENICYVAAMGRLFENTPDRGIYKTSDGGNTWNQILYVNDSSGGIDLVLDPSMPSTIYAATWERVRRPGSRKYGGPGSGLFKSVNGGETWSKLENGLPTGTGRIGLAISKSNPNVLYASFVETNSQLIEGIFRTNNGGQTWIPLNSDDIVSVPFMYWFGKMEVDPSDSETVYFTSLTNWKTTNGGDTWSNVFSGVHVDQHAFAIDEDTPLRVVNGNDGGVYISTNGGVSNTRISGLPNTQFYTCEVDFQNPEIYYGGTQDNGTNRSNSVGSESWQGILGGDGFVVRVDPEDPQFVYAESQNGNFTKSIDGGLSFDSALSGIPFSDRKNWKSPFILDPVDPNILYFGTNKLYKSEDRAENWTAISGDLTSDPVQQGLTFGTITTISASELDGQVLAVGTDDGMVQVTENGGDSWTKVSDELPLRWVTSVTCDPQVREGIYITYSGFRFGEDIGKVYYSEDLGENWIDITTDLPDVPINDLIVVSDNGHLYIATDIGVFYSEERGGSWDLLSSEIPNVVISDLTFHPPTGRLVAATYGRGMYMLEAEAPVSSTDDLQAVDLNFLVTPNPVSDLIGIHINAQKSSSFAFNILDASGRLIHNYKREGQYIDLRVSASGLKAGLYFIQLFDINSGHSQVQKIIKI